MVYTTWPETECADGCLMYTGGSPWLCTERQQIDAPDGDWTTDLQLHLYNIRIRTWTRLKWRDDSPRPPGRGFATLTEYQNQSGENSLFLVGGLPSHQDESEAWELIISGVCLSRRCVNSFSVQQHVTMYCY